MLNKAQLSSVWLPFTANGEFRENPRLLARAEGKYYYDNEGRKVLDAASGLWCSNLGHCHPLISQAIAKSSQELDFAPSFLYSHPQIFELGYRLKEEVLPDNIGTVFFCNSGSEADDSAIKIALAYQKTRGKGDKNFIIGREGGYHGVNIGGTSVGGIPKNRNWYRNLMPHVAHFPSTLNLEQHAFTKGQAAASANDTLALEKLITQLDPSNIAALIIEPVSGSAGVLIPPHEYLQKVRKICSDNDILLIFDEVITAFGRLGAMSGSEYFNVQPDIITIAKGLTNGAVPMGAVAVADYIHAHMLEVSGKQNIDLYHGYTYSGHPLAVAAALATLDAYQSTTKPKPLDNAKSLIPKFEQAVHTLDHLPGICDVRNIGLMAAVQLTATAPNQELKVFRFLKKAFYEHDILFRVGGDNIVIIPHLIDAPEDIDKIVTTIAAIIPEIS